VDPLFVVLSLSATLASSSSLRYCFYPRSHGNSTALILFVACLSASSVALLDPDSGVVGNVVI
jgi:hypothetical protein